MNSDSQLPPQVREAIHDNRKIEAIKLLRETEGLSLKQAKLKVEGYMAEHPELAGKRAAGGGAAKQLAILIVFLVLAYFIYRVFAH